MSFESTDETLQWLHLSDLHARVRDDWDARELTDALVTDLRHLQRTHGLRPNFILFTGDCAFGASPTEAMPEQYQLGRQFFDAVRQAFEPEIPLRDLYLVPGNHDVNRNEVTAGETEWLRHPARNLDDVISAMRDKTRQWRLWMERLANYRAFLTSYGLLHLSPDDPHLLWTDAREIAGFRIGLVGLNSAWSCVDDDDKGRLWCGTDWQISQARQRLGPVSFTLALIHHPPNWFTDREDPSGARRLRHSFEVMLHGHEHQDWVETFNDSRVWVSAGASYQCSWMPNGYNLGRIDLRTRDAEVWLRQWDPSGRGWVPRDVAHRTNNGVWALRPLTWVQPLRTALRRRTSTAQAPEAPQGLAPESAGEHFTRRYCQHVIDQNDVLELFGCDIPRELQRHQLSVAYVSLNLAEEDSLGAASLDPHSGTSTGVSNSQKSPAATPPTLSASGIEHTLDDISAKTNRLMILGPAGAGKTTLLRWCAITASREVIDSIDGEHDSVLSPAQIRKAETVSLAWRDKVPVLIRLRDCPDGRLPPAAELPRFVAKHLPSAPDGWMTELLGAGRCLVLFDGVDEVHRDRRIRLAEEISEFVRTYPNCT